MEYSCSEYENKLPKTQNLPRPASFSKMPQSVSFSNLPQSTSFSNLPQSASFSNLPQSASFWNLPHYQVCLNIKSTLICLILNSKTITPMTPNSPLPKLPLEQGEGLFPKDLGVSLSLGLGTPLSTEGPYCFPPTPPATFLIFIIPSLFNIPNMNHFP